MNTLPDYLATGLEIVFVGTNPGAYSAETGHYYAHPRNRFWGAVNKSGLLDEPLDATRDHLVLEQKVGLTDLVKWARPASFKVIPHYKLALKTVDPKNTN